MVFKLQWIYNGPLWSALITRSWFKQLVVFIITQTCKTQLEGNLCFSFLSRAVMLLFSFIFLMYHSTVSIATFCFAVFASQLLAPFPLPSLNFHFPRSPDLFTLF